MDSLLASIELQEFRQQKTEIFARLASLTLLGYEMMITMDKEVMLFWGARISSVQVIYFMNRCNGLLAAALDTLEYLFVPSTNFFWHGCIK